MFGLVSSGRGGMCVCGGVGRYMGLGNVMKRGYKGGFGHRVFNLACMISHQGFFRANKSNLAL